MASICLHYKSGWPMGRSFQLRTKLTNIFKEIHPIIATQLTSTLAHHPLIGSSFPTGSSLGSFNATTGDNYYFTKTGGSSIYDWQFNIGGNLYPNYRPTGQGQTFFVLQKALTSQYDLVGGVDYDNSAPTLSVFANFWSCAVQLDHGSDGGERYRSGLNFNGNYLGCYFNSNKISTAAAPNGNVICHVHCETTCVMTIEAGKQFVVSY